MLISISKATLYQFSIFRAAFITSDLAKSDDWKGCFSFASALTVIRVPLLIYFETSLSLKSANLPVPSDIPVLRDIH